MRTPISTRPRLLCSTSFCGFPILKGAKLRSLMHIKRIEKIIEDMNLDLPELVREGCRELLAQIGEKNRPDRA